MIIQTERLQLRPLIIQDAKAYVEISRNHGFQLFQISNYYKSSVEEAEEWIENLNKHHQRNGFGIVGVFTNDGPKLIGLAALKYLDEERNSPVELMYRLSDQYWGRGYGYETAKAVCDYAFEKLDLMNICATVDPRNESSRKILKRLGFMFKGTIGVQGLTEEYYELFK